MHIESVTGERNLGQHETDAHAKRACPRIAVTAYLEVVRWGAWERAAAIVPRVYLDAVVRAGGTPILLPPVRSDVSVLDLFDALVLIGGPDIEPASYGKRPHPTVVRTRPQRDAHETALVHAALERDLPLLGVCRGAQVLNVALGGTLQQHLPNVIGHERHQPAPGVFGSSVVRIESGSLLADILGELTEVPCYHHQALAEVADGLRVVARAADGTIEAVELPDRRWALGVQWHPEENAEDNRLFDALVDAARGDTILTTRELRSPSR